jgi:hypothetical protein
MGLEAATRLKTTGTGLALTLDPAWEIWGPAGGYLAAIALRAVGEQAEARQRPITLTGQFVGVAKPGQLEVAVEVLKPGGAALYAVRLSQDGRLIFLAQIWTTARCEPSHPIAPKMPPVPPTVKLRRHARLLRSARRRGNSVLAKHRRASREPKLGGRAAAGRSSPAALDALLRLGADRAPFPGGDAERLADRHRRVARALASVDRTGGLSCAIAGLDRLVSPT